MLDASQFVVDIEPTDLDQLYLEYDRSLHAATKGDIWFDETRG
jgi:hypothetical protein